MNITHRFWTFEPPKNMSVQDFMKEYQRRFQDLKEHTSITADVEYQMKYLFLFHITNLNPDLANRCRDLAFTEMISECLRWTSTPIKAKNSNPQNSSIKCNFCGINGHVEKDCRKKKKIAKQNSQKVTESENKNKILSLNRNIDSSDFQLDTAADFHVSGNLNDFSSYSSSIQTVRVAGGGQVITAGCGNLIFPSIDHKTEILTGAIHLPGQDFRILSTSQLEKQGFSIRWPPNYQDIELIRPDGSICSIFHRKNGRLICKPPAPNAEQPELNSVKRDWHSILGHPGQKAQESTLALAGIKGCKISIECEICAKSKITKCKGHGSIRTASSFGEVIHMDLVGGQKSLSPVTSDTSVPNATWFLLAIDEFTSWKWAWPIYSKKTVPTQIRYLLENLKTKFNVVPKHLHTDSGTEFSNSELQEDLLSRGIEWHKSSSHAPEQNGIIERNVRTVTEKMRSLYLQSGLQLNLWPIILTAAINILNVTPNSTAPQSSYFAVFQKLPEIKHLHPFGCRAFWLEPDKCKLKSKAHEGIYVGTEFKGGHLILNPDTKRIIVRRDIRVHENSFPLRKQVLATLNNNRSIIDTALSGPRAKEWRKAIDQELENMDRNQVWKLVPRSEANGKLMTGKWILKEKSDGKLKARWCARGFSEPFVDDTYAEVLPPTTMRMLLSLAATNNLHIRHIDITAAFLHAEIDHPIYIEQPHGREKPGNLVCKLFKSIYGLRTAPKRWQTKLRKTLMEMQFQPLKSDTNVFRRGNTLISTYVDDFMIISSSRTQIENLIKAMAEAFQLKDLGDMTRFLGINIENESDGIRINQQDKIEALCEDMNLIHCKGASTPISDDNLIDRNTENLCSTDEAVRFRSAVGTLLHIANMTRPDIQYAVNRLCRYVHNPSQNALLSLKHLVRYISRTKSASLLFSKNSKPELNASSDSSWGNISSPKGTSGIIFFIGGSPIAWWSKKQTVTAQSTCEAEYDALTKLAIAAQWLRPLYEELFQVTTKPIPTEIDNTAVLSIANSDKISARNRHFLMRQSTVRDSVKEGLIKLIYTPTDLCRADGLTKSLQRIKHTAFCDQIKMDLKHSVSRGV